MRNKKIVFLFCYVAGLFVAPHGLSDVLHALDGALHLRVFDDGRLERDRSGHGFSRDVGDVNIGGKKASAFLLLRRPFHGGEEHEVWNGVDEDLRHGERNQFGFKSFKKEINK